MSKRTIGNGRELMDTARVAEAYVPGMPADIEDSGRYTKTSITIQLVGEEEIPVTYDALMGMLSQQHPGGLKVSIEQRETRIRRVKFGPRYL